MSTSDTQTETESRWFILPLVELPPPFENSPGGETVPAHVDREGVTKWSGPHYHFEEGTFPGLPFADETMFVGKLYGTPDALDAVADESGAHGRRAYGLSKAMVARCLNDHLGRERTFEAWTAVFGVSE